MRRLLFRAFRWTWVAQHWQSRRFTRAGSLALVSVLAAAVVGLDTNRTLAYQAFAFLIALLTAALLASLTFRARLTVRRAMPRFGTAGEPLRYRVTVRNDGSRAQRGLVLLEDTEDPRPSLAEFLAAREPGEERRNWFDRTVGYPRWMWLIERRRGARFTATAVPPLLPGGEVEVRMEAVPVRRGRLRLDGITMGRPDPFGLFRGFVGVRAPQSLMILPRRYPVPDLDLPGSRRYQQGGVQLAASVGDSEEFASLRDYRPGDPLRRIHWRSWARVGKPVVKEYQDEFFVRHALVLDTFGHPHAAPVFEDAVSVAASFAVAIPSQDCLLDLMFVGTEAYCFTAGRGLAHADRMLEILAGVEPCVGKPFAALRGAVLARHGELSGAIVVLLAWDAERRAFVEALRGAGIPTLALVITPPGAPPEPSAADHVLAPHWLEVGKIAEGLARL
ncbi:MAG TPA: DUF58 domain-containing protein [Verrucomicrobiae bacterium]|jgi:uncharacterized protein (DUF58 family)|nr:DUF58 domain-containing protein [Verrucomicrobiae bacterium]